MSEDLQDQMPTRSDKHLFEGIEDFALQEIANQRGVAKLEDLRFAHFQKEMDLINKAYYTVMAEGGANVQPFIFPIPRVNIIEDFDWESENCDLLFEKTAKIGSSYFQNFIGSQYILDEEGNRIANPEAYTPNAVRSMCCRLQLDQRKGFLEGVVLSGRECTLHKDIIPAIREIKEMELAVKIDTHGSRPELVSTLYRERLIDYVALGFKALSRSYLAVTASDLYTSFVETLDLLLASDIKFEILTIVHSQLISLDDLLEMKQYLKGRGYRGDYFIQYFVDDKTTIGSLEPTYRFRDLSQWDDDQIRFVVRN